MLFYYILDKELCP